VKSGKYTKFTYILLVCNC